MQAGKRYTFWQTVNWTKKHIFLFLIYHSIAVGIVFILDIPWLILPWQPLSLIGIAVAFYLGFKNNSSYERLWEARKIWGGIVNASRSFTIMARDFVTDQFADRDWPESDLFEIRKTLVHRHVAWLKALSIQLRKLKRWEHETKGDQAMRHKVGTAFSESQFEDLKPYLSTGDLGYILSKGNRASHLLSLQSKHLAELRRDGLIDDFRHMEMEDILRELYTLQGKSERIKNFPFPRQYATANFFFVCIFIALLPFCLMSVFYKGEISPVIWLTVPFAVLASWVFWVMEMIGDYSENPFEGLYNDVPISSMARSIEIDIRQMLDEEDLPPPLEPVGNMDILI